MQQLISIETIPISVKYVEKKPSPASKQQSEIKQLEKQEDSLVVKNNLRLLKNEDSFQTNLSSEKNVLTYSAAAPYSPSATPLSLASPVKEPVLELKVLERPRVIIKYLGGPTYIPKSADPNYVQPKEIELIGDGKSSFDTKA